MSDPLVTSADTWVEGGTQTLAINPDLQRPHDVTPLERLRMWRRRHLIRRDHSQQTFLASRNPERGLPVAEDKVVLTFLRKLFRPRRNIIIVLIVLNVVAALTALIVPQLLGRLIDSAQHDPGSLPSMLGPTVGWSLVVVIIQATLVFAARWVASVFGQDVLASAREAVVRSVLRLPLGRIESASTGDLVTRVTRDVGNMAVSVRWAIPTMLVALSSMVFTVVGLLLNSWLLAIPVLICLGILTWVVGDYYRWASAGYITEGAAYSTIQSSISETVEGVRTTEAFRLRDQRVEISEGDIEGAAQAERYTLTLRNKLFFGFDVLMPAPLAGIVMLGIWGYHNDWVTLGQITAAAMYSQQLIGPVAAFVHVLDILQVGLASTTRLLGISTVPPDREATDQEPIDDHVQAHDLHFAYREGHDVLHGVDLDLRQGERLAIVGPSGSGKSTLARLLSGINRPRTGVVEVGEKDVMDFPLEQLRTEVALVTQEHHVFVGSIRDNIVLAREQTATNEQVWSALRAVQAADWVERLPDQLRTEVGSGNLALTPAQAQQVALARLVIADPHTLVLDEATSLIDPHTARHLEGSMATLLSDRTVVAIAHRLHTAYDADRIAVVIDGKIAELGSHDELMAADGEYASLWRAWTE